MQTKTALSRASRERENVSAQLTQAEQIKIVAEGELAEVTHCCPLWNVVTALAIAGKVTDMDVPVI